MIALDEALAPLVGAADAVVPCDGRARRYANLDYATSTHVMAAVREAIEAFEAFVPWYRSVHRGSGVKSPLSTHLSRSSWSTRVGIGDERLFAGSRAPAPTFDISSFDIDVSM